MRPLRRPLRSTIHYHGREADAGMHIVTFSINGIRWEYTLNALQTDNCEYIVRKAGAPKALAYAKRFGRARCLSADERSATLLRNRGALASRTKRLKVTLPNV